MVTRKKTLKKKAIDEEKLLPLPAAFWDHHKDILDPLVEQWRNLKRVPPVLLLTGPKGIGKRQVCHYLTQVVQCEKGTFASLSQQHESEDENFSMGFFGAPPEPSQSIYPCGICGACQRALHQNWINFEEILPSGAEGGKSGSIKIDAFRNLKSQQGFGSHGGGYKVILIHDAEAMTLQAANSLLKILEEPPRDWIFLLTASDPSLLLPTITSRCQRLRLKPFALENILELMKIGDIPVARRSICAQLSQGSWEKAKNLAQDETWEKREAIFRFLSYPESEVHTLVDWASQEPRHLQLLLDQMEFVTSDLVHWTLHEEASPYTWLNTDGARTLEGHAHRVMSRTHTLQDARQFWLAITEKMDEVRQRMGAPLNRKLLAQELLLPWLDA